MSPEISVIIVNYNAGNELIRCVRSVAETEEDLEIIVVDNASHDGSIDELLDSYDKVKKLHTLNNTTNLGFAVACNQGTRAARGEFLFYLNPDCLVEPQTIPILRDTLKNSPQAGMAGGLILNSDGSEQRGCRREIPTPWKSMVNSFGLKKFSWINRKVFSDFRLDSQPLPEKPVEVEAISGACMLVSRKAMETVGPMDEGYFLHCEDLDWCMRFRQEGWKIMFVPAAKLVHSKGSCSSSRPFFVEWKKHKGMARFYNKFFARQQSKPLQMLVWLGIWLRFVLSAGAILMNRFFGTRGNSGR